MVNIIETKGLKKIYNPYSSNPKIALKGIDLKIKQGEFICFMGPSGSGKTTLINIISTIDDITSGEVIIFGNNITVMSEKQRSLLRGDEIGFIFQSYNLIESLTIRNNILFAIRLTNAKVEDHQEYLDDLTKILDIHDILDKYPFECSGGEQQRAAIARALIMKPKLLFADEPTGNLDSLNTKEIMLLFKKINETSDTTIILVSHDSLVASYSSKMYYLEDGLINTSIERKDKSQEKYYSEIMAITTKIDLQLV